MDENSRSPLIESILQTNSNYLETWKSRYKNIAEYSFKVAQNIVYQEIQAYMLWEMFKEHFQGSISIHKFMTPNGAYEFVMDLKSKILPFAIEKTNEVLNEDDQFGNLYVSEIRNLVVQANTSSDSMDILQCIFLIETSKCDMLYHWMSFVIFGTGRLSSFEIFSNKRLVQRCLPSGFDKTMLDDYIVVARILARMIINRNNGDEPIVDLWE